MRLILIDSVSMSFRIPGPVCVFLNALPIDEHTLSLVCSPHPGPVAHPKVNKKTAQKSPGKKAAINLNALLNQYAQLFITCEIKPSIVGKADHIIDRILENRPRYEAVEQQSKVPWYMVGVIHHMEADLRFDRHLHNGDPLTARTVHVPAGRPATGNAPFKWEESAVDALLLKKFDDDWSLLMILKKIEDYNGTGYRRYHPEVNTPYLWSGSNHYAAGKYVADGKFSSTAISGQIGAAVILRRMMERNVIYNTLVPIREMPYSIYYA